LYTHCIWYAFLYSPGGYQHSPPPLRIPNPGKSPLQAFQHFKRGDPSSAAAAAAMYRFAATGGQPPPQGLLNPGGHPGGPDPRLFGAHPLYGPPGGPYGISHMPQGAPVSQPLFPTSPFEYR